MSKKKKTTVKSSDKKEGLTFGKALDKILESGNKKKKKKE